jgi:hypothetical protein
LAASITVLTAPGALAGEIAVRPSAESTAVETGVVGGGPPEGGGLAGGATCAPPVPGAAKAGAVRPKTAIDIDVAIAGTRLRPSAKVRKLKTPS